MFTFWTWTISFLYIENRAPSSSSTQTIMTSLLKLVVLL